MLKLPNICLSSTDNTYDAHNPKNTPYFTVNTVNFFSVSPLKC